MSLYWLPVKYRIIFNMYTIIYQAQHCKQSSCSASII